jgi:hypothetical protein
LLWTGKRPRCQTALAFKTHGEIPWDSIRLGGFRSRMCWLCCHLWSRSPSSVRIYMSLTVAFEQVQHGWCYAYFIRMWNGLTSRDIWHNHVFSFLIFFQPFILTCLGTFTYPSGHLPIYAI